MATHTCRDTVPQQHRYLDSVACQNLFYGTAWKGEHTADLVCAAIKAGFRRIATAAQPKHYREDLVGEGVRRAIQANIVTRKDLYIQTTFTPFHSQDPDNCPYDPHLGIAKQVDASLQASRQHFADPLTNRPGYLDAVILHDLYPSPDDNATVWKSLSTHIGQATVQRLGLSNVDKSDLECIIALHEHQVNTFARPMVVQNRFHQRNDYDAEVRVVCKASCITYQAYGVRANSNMLNHQSSTVSVADTAKVGREAALYGLVMNGLGYVADDNTSLDVQIVVGASKTARMAVLEEVRRVLMYLNDAHCRWNIACLDQRRDSAVEGHDQSGDSLDDGRARKMPEDTRSPRLTETNLGARLEEGGSYRLARHAFLNALGISETWGNTTRETQYQS